MSKKPLSTKQSMLVFWAVASLLWVTFSTYMFELREVRAAYDMHSKYEMQYLKGNRTGYYRRAIDRSLERVARANKKLGMFFLIGLGFPGIMLAVGTMALENVSDTPKKKKR